MTTSAAERRAIFDKALAKMRELNAAPSNTKSVHFDGEETV